MLMRQFFFSVSWNVFPFRCIRLCWKCQSNMCFRRVFLAQTTTKKNYRRKKKAANMINFMPHCFAWFVCLVFLLAFTSLKLLFNQCSWNVENQIRSEWGKGRERQQRKKKTWFRSAKVQGAMQLSSIPTLPPIMNHRNKKIRSDIEQMLHQERERKMALWFWIQLEAKIKRRW